jgi:hypothetical protein
VLDCSWIAPRTAARVAVVGVWLAGGDEVEEEALHHLAEGVLKGLGADQHPADHAVDFLKSRTETNVRRWTKH